MSPARIFFICLFVFPGSLILPAHSFELHEDQLGPLETTLHSIFTPDWAEPALRKAASEWPPTQTFGVLASSVQQPQGVLSGKIVFMNSGHGWTYETNTVTPYWRLQRGV